MEVGMLPLLAPLMQAQATAAVPGGAENAPQAGFAGLLAMLQQGPEFEPAQAMLSLQMASPEEQGSTMLPYLLMSLLPQLTGEQSGEVGEMAEDLEEQLVDPALMALLSPMFGQAPSGQQTDSATEGREITAAVAEILSETDATKLTGLAEEAQDSTTTEHDLQNKPLFPELKQADGEAGGKKRPMELTPAKPSESKVTEPKRTPSDIPVEQAQRPMAQQDPFRALLQTPANDQMSRAAIVEQVMEKMVLVREPEGESTLFVRLRPAVLGEVEVRLRMEEGRLVASILTENVQVKEALDGALSQLRQRLEAQQIHVAEMTVSVNQEQNSRHGKAFQDLWQQHPGIGNVSLPDAAEEIPQSTGLIPGVLDMRA
ncbi:flagellar hook-length control protein FliK [Dethiobacter alkaliphilus]|uniref:flagellar hook-length control protein FliK n=1 Tax=Dethiobacter alkaliphilus TaxID=427926 RepID=UPI00222809F6|nr:flagellar hook-length control protein FliK [Dethiobacter alkaliphilus]MCW3488743.1 flagellar hook-length control protein FliK [Dethiobacter alkaliphilus]